MTAEKDIVPIKNDVVVNEQQSIMEKLLSAMQSGLDVKALEKFMDLAERQQAKEAEQAFNRAFAAFKADPPKIIKDALVDYIAKTGKRTTYKHASIGNVVDSIISGMSQHGLSHMWLLDQEGGMIKVTCRIVHEMGHYIETTLSAGADTSGGKNSIQGIASTVTYLERYTLQAATGIAVLENDDDGQSHVDAGPQVTQTTSQDAVDAWLTAIDGYTDKTLDEFLDWRDQGSLNNFIEWAEEHDKQGARDIKSAITDMENHLQEKGQ